MNALVRLVAVFAALAALIYAPQSSAAPAASGCSAAPATAPGTTVGRSLTSGGRARSYLLHIRANYASGKQFPLNSIVQHYRIDGGGHTWPGSANPSGPGNTTHIISATQVMWQFFTAHSLMTASH